MKTNELTGSALDWAVSKCEGYDCQLDDEVSGPWLVPQDGYLHSEKPLRKMRYFSDWSLSGPIIEREGIAILQCPRGWAARIGFGGEYIEGPTPLIAAMRCYVAIKLGDDVEVPEVTA